MIILLYALYAECQGVFCIIFKKGGYYLNTQEIIDNLCKSRGCKKSKIEDELKLGGGYLSRVKNPSLDKLQKIADYFDVSVDYLTTGKELEIEEKYGKEVTHLYAKIRNDENLRNALLKYFKLSEKKRNHVIELIGLLFE